MWYIIPGAALFGYLVGAIPVGLWICRLYGVDIRTVGSGRTGTTNAWRAAGLKAAIPTLLGDALKGVVAVLLIRSIFYMLFPEPDSMTLDEASARQLVVHLAEALGGGLSIVGHNWSIFNGFKGGAGGITAAATTMAISPLVGGIVWVVGAFLIWWTRMASVATFSVALSAFAGFLILGVNQLTPWPYIFYGVIASVAIFIALRRNREALRRGEERVITIW